ncbi:ECF transporter S component [Eubacterium coprostanoligenes]|uniref:Energy-coupling factor transport system substrate-specific component n=1 Tax=Eubacterium coprostanoligenes TaxID=290054 RepID=A0A1T4LBZ1_9FIRM|nr:ECF transporter S component [Eubacterium coprostanoligenes]MCI6253550.1 ECF transporter S component [Eubacterium coprostanoligenes]MCI6361863.1 ECF transporter S component [Eubacterium coprostanoligenes]MCI7264332.1 ECF transporter S component [Eubacterium coprostanoligenes]MDY5399477.1 ECF transporter S component [Eubacterium coprostanoligenes]SJZ52181.1 energy-coupling factor transport system substrate-specific component [Eubacterium coprostanoligenes]
MKKAFLYITVALSLAFIVLWQFLFADSVNYYIVSVVILIASMLPFFVSYEQKKVTARDITLTATLIALAVVSRAAFYLVPQVKPIAAVVIVSAVCLGAHKGYIVGAFSAFVSNFIFGQGMWTPFQMVALGTVGLLAGLIFRWLKVNRYTLSIVGFVLATVVYGAIVDMSTVLSAYGNNVTLKGALSIYASGAVFSLVFGGATAVFLFLFGMPFITKIERISKKYGLN